MTPTPAGTDAAARLEARLDLAARVAAHERFLRSLKTEVLSQAELADLFGISKNYVRGFLERMDGAERVGGLAGGFRFSACRRPTSRPPACFAWRIATPPDMSSGGVTAELASSPNAGRRPVPHVADA